MLSYKSAIIAAFDTVETDCSPYFFCITGHEIETTKSSRAKGENPWYTSPIWSRLSRRN